MKEEKKSPNETSVIDNEKSSMVEHLNSILPSTTRASIAVGYFFISGFAEIMNSLNKIEESDDQNHKIRLLISPTTNRKTAEALLAGHESLVDVKKNSTRTDTSTTDDAIRETINTLEYMPQTKPEQDAVAKLIQLIEKGKLQVKVYLKDKLHAKAYIFELEGGIIKKVAIVGSSNLSISGIREHTELNLRTNTPEKAEELLKWFNRHWDDPSCMPFTEELADVLSKSWAAKFHKPKQVYGKAITHTHGVFPEIPGDDMMNELFDFQKIAVASAIKKIEKYGGVLIADVVGTGKSYIGSAILKFLYHKYRSTPLIICPPHLEGMWRDYMEKFGLFPVILSRYKIGLKPELLTKYRNCDIVLVDESHNFRNKNGGSYSALLAFMEEKTDEAKIIMLSATPISNGLTDLKNQLKLFPQDLLEQIPALNGGDLDAYFKGTSGTAVVTPEIKLKMQDLLKNILIRRTRSQIKDPDKHDERGYYLEKNGVKKYFPERELAHPAEYDCEEVYCDNFENIEGTIKELKLARYSPGNYIKTEYLQSSHPDSKKYTELRTTTKPMVGLIRTSLLKRMESSIAAFASTVKHSKNGYLEFMCQLDAGRVPIGKEFRDEIYKKVYDYDDYDDYDKKISEITSNYDVDAFEVERWKVDIKSDMERFSDIERYIGIKPGETDKIKHERFITHDAKLNRLIELLKKENIGKTLIFSESAVTVRYIASHIIDVMNDKVVEQIDSKLDNSKKIKIIGRFDPKNNDYELENNEREIDILVSTDVLSEGVNLQAGKTIINYDFHWNPVRLIQRIGRVDRIGSEHNVIKVVNFLPTTQMEKSLKLYEKVENKINTIRKIIGGDQKILDEKEPLDSDKIIDIYNCNNDVLDDSALGVLDFMTRGSEHDAEMLRRNKDELEKIESLPFGIRSLAGNEILVIACEADSDILDEFGNIVQNEKFRKYYEVSKDGKPPKDIWESSFLNYLVKNKEKVSSDDSQYNELVSKGWIQFEKSMDKVETRNRLLKHQKRHDKKLRELSENPLFARDAKRLLPFVDQFMLANRDPYKKLLELSATIDGKLDMNDQDIINELIKIHDSHPGAKLTRNIHKPRILYSMMVDT